MTTKTSWTAILSLLLWAVLSHAQDAVETNRRISSDASHGFEDRCFGDGRIYKTGFGSLDAFNTHRYRYRSVGPLKYRYYRKKFGAHRYPTYLRRYRYYTRYPVWSPIYPYDDYRYRYGDKPHKDYLYGYHSPENNIIRDRPKSRVGTGTRFNSIRRPSSAFRSRFTFRGGSIGR